MVSLSSLWLPIVLSAVLVFVASSVLHMVVAYHNRDYTKLPNEDAVRAAIRAGNPAPRQYIIPYAARMAEMASPEMQEKFREGPVAVLNIKPSGAISIGPSLGQWFVFSLVVSFLCAVVASGALVAGATRRQVFHIVGLVAWLAYAAGQLPAAIWMGKPWSVATKEVIDGFVYAVVTAAAFAYLWPR